MGDSVHPYKWCKGALLHEAAVPVRKNLRNIDINIEVFTLEIPLLL